MKRLLLLFIPLMFFFSCELFEEEQDLDSDLFGAWKADIVVLNTATFMPELDETWKIFNQDGTYAASWPNVGNAGDWWVDGDMLIFDSSDGNLVEWQYYVEGDTFRRIWHTEPGGVDFLDTNGDDIPDTFVAQQGPPYYITFIKQWD